MPSPAELWAAADAAWARRDVEATLRLVDELLAQSPTHLDALNLSGFVRTSVLTDSSGAWEQGVAHLERALDADTTDSRVIANYAEAFVRKGRGAAAVPRVTAWTDKHPNDAIALNVLGWLLAVVGDDLVAGRAALERAVRSRDRFGDARLNLGRVFMKLRDWPSAVEQLTLAIQSGNCWRPHEAWKRLGEARVARGQLRRALGAFRRAQEVDAKGEYTRQLFDAVNALTHVLHQHRRFILNVFDETARNKQFEAGHARGAPLQPLVALAEQARHLRSHVGEHALTALECIEEQASRRALLPRWSDQSATFDLEQHGGDEGRALGLAWRGALLELYDELLEREEPSFDDTTPLADARKAAAERRWDDALAALSLHRSAQPGSLHPEVVAELGERWGDRLVFLGESARARDFYATAEWGLEVFASWAGSGGEGVARMAELERVQKKRLA